MSPYVLPGTLASRYMRCGKTNCRCKADPPVLHGGYAWRKPGLDRKTRSMLNLAILTALGRPDELGIYVKGALAVLRSQPTQRIAQADRACPRKRVSRARWRRPAGMGTMTLVDAQTPAAASDDLAEVISRELLLLDPAIRANPRRVRELLHRDFVEFGASGRRWDTDSTVQGARPIPQPHRERRTT